MFKLGVLFIGLGISALLSMAVETRPVWTTEMTHQGENVVITVRVHQNGIWEKDLTIPFDKKLGGIRLITCIPEMEAVVTSDDATLPMAGKPHRVGDVILLRFGAHTIESEGREKNSIAAVRVNPLMTVALQAAGENRNELLAALAQSPEATRADMIFLILNMPLRDLSELKAAYLLENVEYARKAFDEAPWKVSVGEALYREAVLPYANLSESREKWRKLFYEKFSSTVKGIESPGEAAIHLNQTIFKELGVQYHATKRKRPDQGPLESIELGYASCSGLSILLVDACRAVGIPARVAGVAQWTNGPGNHTWVEVWDDGWHVVGAAESTALDDIWFGAGVAAADASNPMLRVYAARFQRDTLRFPMSWNPYADYVSAEDVTARYKKQFGSSVPELPLEKHEN